MTTGSAMSSKKKWLIAQQHEKEYYETGKNLVWGIPHSLQYWKDFLHLEIIGDNTIEIGCGPNGLYNFSDKVVGLDPINFHKRNFVLGISENLPFRDVSCIICCNGIDHFSNPQLAVDEMFRIVKYEGKIILWVYTYPRIISWLLAKFDKTHPFHFTRVDIWKLLGGVYDKSVPAIVCSYNVTYKHRTSFFETHWKYTKSKFTKLKLFIGHILGIRGLCLHMEVCQ